MSVLLCTALFTVPVMAGGVSAKQIGAKSTYLNIKEISISENVQKTKVLSENDQYKELEKTILNGDFKVGKESFIEMIDPSDKTPVQVLTTVIVKDGKPGVMGVVTKNGESFAGAIIGESSDTGGINVSVTKIGADKKIVTEANKIQKKPENKILSYFVKPVNAADPFCVEFCNAMCSMGWGFAGCYLLCTGLSLGSGVLLCGFLCAGFTWQACNYGCPWWSLCTLSFNYRKNLSYFGNYFYLFLFNYILFLT